MSEPVTNVAIEDVLSSIRRLVSEDSRVRSVPGQTDPDWLADQYQADAAGSGERVEKLVLTPALRVAAPLDSAPADAPQELAGAADDALAASQQDAAYIPELAGAGAGVIIPDTDDGTASGGGPLDDADAPQDIGDDASAPADAVVWSELSDVTLESMSDALSWEDHHANQPATSSPPQGEALLASVMAAANDATPDSTDPAQDNGAEATQTAPDDSDPAEEVVFTSVRDNTEQARADTFEDVQDPAEEPSDSLFETDDTFLDEEMLRELVTDIVRQELQGALGERITRNVRKLVRREIHRALTSHELD